MLSQTSSMAILSSFDAPKYTHRNGRLEDCGDARENSLVKGVVSKGDEKLQEALDKFEAGDSNELDNLVSNGVLSKRTSLDLLEDLDFHFLQQTGLEEANGVEAGNLTTPSSQANHHSMQSSLGAVSSLMSLSSAPVSYQRRRSENELSLDDIAFDEFDHEEEGQDSQAVERRDRSSSICSVNSMSGFGLNGSNTSPSMLGQNFPDVFDDENGLSGSGIRPNTRPSSRRNVLTISASGLTCTPSADITKSRVESSVAADQLEEFDSLDGLNESAPESQAQPHYVGAYSPEARRQRVARFMEKRGRRIWTKKVKYDVRKNFADSRMRVKGRFVRKEDEELLRDLLSLT